MKKRNSMKRKVMTLLVSVMLVFASVSCASAVTREGSGATAFDGPASNTFAAGLPLATVYLDPIEIKKGPSDLSYNGSKLTSGGTTGKNAQIWGNELTGNNVESNLGTFTYTYKDAAIHSDGSRGDLIVELKVNKITTAGSATGSLDGKVTLTDMSSTASGFELSIGTLNSSGVWGVCAEVDTKITVTGASGDFVIPANGANIRKSSGDSYYQGLYNLDPTNGTYVRETLIFPDSNVFYPSNSDEEVTVDGGKVYMRANGVGAPNKNYRSGMVTIGASGYTVSFQGMGSSSSTASVRSNVMNLSLGDLQHRIWSGSGPNGKIETGKNGTGTGLDGGTFTGEISAINGDESTIRRYVIPDDKTGVTYTMTPDSGYALDKVVVDGNSYTVPDTPEASATIANTDGNGTLEHKGSGVFTYKFNNANTKDHSIYVIWKKTKEDPTTTTTNTKPAGSTTTAAVATTEPGDSDSEDKEYDKNASTGDRFMPFMIGGIMLLAAAVIILTLIHRRRQDS